MHNYWKIASMLIMFKFTLDFIYYGATFMIKLYFCKSVLEAHWITLVNCSFQLTRHWRWPNYVISIDGRLDRWHWCMVTFKLALVWLIVDTSGHYTVFSENTFSEKGVSITQLLIAFIMLVSVVTLPFCPSLFSVVPITFLKFSDFDLYSEIK